MAGTLSLAQLTAEVRAHLAGRDDITDAEIRTALNLQQVRIARIHDWEELQVSSSFTPTFTGDISVDRYIQLSSFETWPYKETWSFRVLDGPGARANALEYVPTRELDKAVPQVDTYGTGFPTRYTVWTDRVELFRVPDAAYEYIVRGIKWPDDLVDAEDLSNLDRKDDMLIAITTSYLYHRCGQYEFGAKFFATFTQLLTDSKVEDLVQPDRLIVPPSELWRAGTGGEPWADPWNTGG